MDLALLALVVSVAAVVLAMIAIGAHRLPKTAEAKAGGVDVDLTLHPSPALKSIAAKAAAPHKAPKAKRPKRAKRRNSTA